MNFTKTSLWQVGFEGQYARDPQAIELRQAYHELSKLAALLVAEVSADLRQYTVHDISHLEALWGVASEILGPGYALTPTEAFVLGGAILLHDAGMSLAAYPGGMREIAATPVWGLILQRIAVDPKHPSESEMSRVTVEFIRLEHANRAAELPKIEWVSPDGVRRALIENGDIRQKFGQIIGEITDSEEVEAASLIRVLDGDPKELKICFTSEGFLSTAELLEFIRKRTSVVVIGETYRRGEVTKWNPDLVSMEFGEPVILQSTGWHNFLSALEEVSPSRNLKTLVSSVIAKAWNIDERLLRELFTGTIEGAYNKYEVPVAFGYKRSKPVRTFGHLIRREMTWEDLEPIAKIAEEARIMSGDYERYLG